MIRTFRHRGLRQLFETGRSARVAPELQSRCLRKLDALDNAETLEELALPGFDLHPLQGDRAGRHAISVNGPWRITFEWNESDAFRVDLEQYH